jgi:hypothetical protein
MQRPLHTARYVAAIASGPVVTFFSLQAFGCLFYLQEEALSVKATSLPHASSARDVLYVPFNPSPAT